MPDLLLLPCCDRCGHGTDVEDLAHDGLGHICPPCRLGAQHAEGH